MHELSFDGVKKYMDATLVLRNASFQVSMGDKVGVIGDNGSGKSTIMKLISGNLKLNHCAGYPYAPVPPGYDEGWVKLSKGTTCSYLEQIPQFEDHMKVIDVLNLSFKEVNEIELKMRALELQMQHLEDDALKYVLNEYSEWIQLYEVKGGYEINEKLGKVCKGLKLSDAFLNQDFHSLSGGEKTRVMLGKLLIDTPNVLLLDEPTNHLDMESIEWLQEYVNGYNGIVIVVSHDRYFLDQIATKIIEVEDKKCQTYSGNYSDYIRQKHEQIEAQMKCFKEQNKQIQSMEHSIKTLRSWACKTDNNKFFSRAGSIQTKLDKMTRVEKPKTKKDALKMCIHTTERSGNLVIEAKAISKRFDHKILFENSNLLVRYGERIALIGPNGCGKTTFLKMLLGQLPCDTGSLSLGANIMMAYLPQNIVFENEAQTVLDFFREGISVSEGKSRAHLAKFLFHGNTVFKKISHLSGGERSRLKLSKLLFQDINLLILDEPTNHLDIGSIESIETALSDFKGTVLFISHDRYFINKISDRVIAIESSDFRSYSGNYDDYKASQN